MADLENRELHTLKDELLAAIAASNASVMVAIAESGAEVRKEIAGLRKAIETMAEMLLPPSQVAEVRRRANG